MMPIETIRILDELLLIAFNNGAKWNNWKQKQGQ